MNYIRDKNDYLKYIKSKQPKQPIIKNCIWAFFVGGFICLIGQFITEFFSSLGIGEENVVSATTITLVFIGAFLTGIGIYDDIGRRAGAGSIVPITGFANSVVSPAMEHKKEGFIFGVAAKMFVISGPVLVYGISSSIIVGIVYYFIK